MARRYSRRYAEACPCAAPPGRTASKHQLFNSAGVNVQVGGWDGLFPCMQAGMIWVRSAVNTCSWVR